MDLPHGKPRVVVPEITSDLYSSSHRVKDGDKPPLGIILSQGVYDPNTLCKSGSALPAIKVGGNQNESEWVSDYPGMRCRGGQSFNDLHLYPQFFPQQRD